jgi:hypothetical protein
MIIKKGEKIYIIRENIKSWSAETDVNGVKIRYNISKSDYPTFKELENYITTDKLFLK